MQAGSLVAIEDVIAHIVADAAQALSKRPGESPQQQIDRAETTEQTIMSLQPCDAVEAMIASRCVMLHDVMVDSVGRLLRGEPAVSRSNIVAMDRAVGNNLARLERYRTAEEADCPPPAEPVADATTDPAAGSLPAEPSAETNDPWPTAAQLAGFNRQSRRAFDRQVRKRINQAVRAATLAGTSRPEVTAVHNGPATTASTTAAG